MAISIPEWGGGPSQPTVDRIDDSRSLDLDGVFHALSNEHRRYLLYYLQVHGTVPAEELVDVVTVATGQNGDRAARERVVTDLRDEHFPILLEANLITCDRNEATVSLAFLPGFLYDWLELARELDRRL